jgi:hypothetical protein
VRAQEIFRNLPIGEPTSATQFDLKARDLTQSTDGVSAHPRSDICRLATSDCHTELAQDQQNHRPIGDYDSAGAFGRALKREYGFSADHWRHNRLIK